MKPSTMRNRFFRNAIVIPVAALSVIYTAVHFSKELYHSVAVYAANERKKSFHYTVRLQGPVMPGYILMSPNKPDDLTAGQLMVMDLAGNILFQRPVSGMVTDFRQWNIAGKRRYTYQQYDVAADQAFAESGSARHLVLLDSELHEIKQIHLLPADGILTDKRQDLDHHDVVFFSEDHYIVLATQVRAAGNIPSCLSPSPRARIGAWYMEEVDHGKVVWQWDATRFPELYMDSQMGNHFYDTTVQDYLHINAMVLDPQDSNLVVSFHNLDEVAKISRKTGQIMWKLGGRHSDYALTPAQVFLRQHHVTIDTGGIIQIFDNGEAAIRPKSRILRFKLDEAAKTVISFEATEIPEPFTGSKGSARKLGDDYFICGGSSCYLLLLDSRTGAKKMELQSSQAFYRACYVPDIKGIPINKK